MFPLNNNLLFMIVILGLAIYILLTTSENFAQNTNKTTKIQQSLYQAKCPYDNDEDGQFLNPLKNGCSCKYNFDGCVSGVCCGGSKHGICCETGATGCDGNKCVYGKPKK